MASRVVADSDSQTVVLDATGLIVASCEDAAQTCASEGVDTITGTIKNKQTIAADLIPSIEATTLSPDGVLVNVNNLKVVLLDPITGAVKATWT